MAAILTAAEMRALEQATIDSGAVTGLELMKRAGKGAVAALLAHWPDAAAGPQRALVLCGPGNNGGDGYVVARHLRKRGWDVRVAAMGDPAKAPPDAAAMRRRFAPEDATVPPLPDYADPEALDALIEWLGAARGRPCYIVDALFGTGLARGIGGPGGPDDLMEVMADLAADGALVPRVLAIDIPSGLCADSGRVLGRDGAAPPEGTGVIPADLTVTFHSLKPGHLLADGPRLCGAVEVVPIGLPDAASPVSLVGAPDLARLAKTSGHKYAHGHALVLAGGCGRGGAARLAARGALRVGAGLVTLAVPPAALQENAARLDAIMLRSVRDAEALAALLVDSRFNALAAGPGLGTGEREAALLAALLDTGRAALLDADALTLLARDASLRARLHPRIVLTPHEGEFARLCPDIDARWHAPATSGPAFSKLDAAREAAAALGCTVLLKGSDTVIATAEGRAAIHAAAYDRAAPWLATAGAGDVLTGMICGLMSRGLPPFDAACSAAWLHVEAARRFGPGLVAEDLPEALPGVFRALGL
jgi:hydroxyethylthiazole kinase-like uncharacterized protein yjeF